MIVYDVYEATNPPRKIGAFYGVVDGNRFSGKWIGRLPAKGSYESLTIRKGENTVLEQCRIEKTEGKTAQSITGRGKPIQT
jgi:hypothetical protein